jgi:hypothetical protein
MKRLFSERSLVVILFVLVVIVFSFAQEDTRKIEEMYFDPASSSITPVTASPKVEPIAGDLSTQELR